MTYGYASSAPTLTLNLTPEQRAAGRDVARLLGLAQTRGATAGEGSLSKLIPQLTAVAKYAGHLRHTGPAERIGDGSANALIASIAQHAHVYGAEFTARKLKWLGN